jgi:hypothetical protein
MTVRVGFLGAENIAKPGAGVLTEDSVAVSFTFA